MFSATILEIVNGPTNLETIGNKLRLDNINLVVASDLAGGIQQANNIHPDLVLLGTDFAETSSLEIYQTLKELEATKDTPIIFILPPDVTADDKIRILSQGGADYLTKPFLAEEALTRIQTQLSLAQLQRQVNEPSKQQSSQTIDRLKNEEPNLQKSVKELSQELDLFQAILDSLPDHIYVKDREGRFYYCNQAMADSLGVSTPDALIGQTAFDFYPHELAAQQYAAEQALTQSGLPLADYEEPGLNLIQNKPSVHLTTKFALKDASGNIIGIVNTSHDITKFKQVEEELRRGQERLKQAQHLAQMGVWEWDIASDETTWSEEMFAIYGIKPEDFTGKGEDYLNFTHPEDSQIQRDNIERAFAKVSASQFQMEANKPAPNEFRLIRPDNTICHVRGDAVAIVNEQGNPVRMLGVLMDITREKEREKALHFQKMLLECQSETSPNGILIVSNEGEWLSFNQRFITMWGIPDKIVANRSNQEALQSILPQLVDPQHFSDQILHLHENPNDQIHNEVLLKNGRVFEQYSHPVRDDQGQHYGRVWFYQDITERRQIARRVQESEERLRNLVEGSIQGVLVHRNTKPLFINSAYAQILGYESTDELLALDSVVSLIAPYDQARLLDYHEARLNGKASPGRYEYDAVRKDGSIVTIQQIVSMIDWDGEPAVLGTIIDITQQRQAEEALRISEERFRYLTLQSPDTIYMLNLSRNQVDFVNHEEFLGYSFQELQLPGSIIDRIHPDDQSRVHHFWQALVTSQEKDVHALDYRLKHKDGHWEWVHNRAVVLSHTAEGNPVEIMVVLTLITESKKAEEIYRQQKEYLRILFEQTPIGIVTIDMNGNVTNANPRSLEILGSPNLSATVGLNVLTLPPLIEAGISSVLEKALSTGKMTEVEAWYKSIWNKTVYLLVRAVPHFGSQSRQLGLIVLVEDLTDRIQAEEGMRQMQKLESLGILAGGVAHDFNNLLVAMLGQTSIAMAKVKPDNPGYPHIEKAVKAADQAALLTQQLLAYSGRGHFQIASLNLNLIIEENLHLFSVTTAKQIRLNIELADELPTVEVDRAQIQQVVMNLIINATEALGDDEGTITIITDTQEINADKPIYSPQLSTYLASGTYVTLEVQDDGPGIPADRVKKIFDPFYTTKEKGQGLGLSAVIGIVKGHKGGLTVKSDVGVGTSFKLWLPARNGHDSVSNPKSIEAELNFKGLVLVIDDEVHVREAIVDILDLEQIEVVAAADGQEGLSLYQQRQKEIRLVLLDLSMPGWNGERTMQELRKFDPNVRIILSSGYSEIEALKRFTGKRLDGFLKKPYSADKLLETIKSNWAPSLDK